MTVITAALVEAQLAIQPGRKNVLFKIHQHPGRKPNREYLVQWSGFPAKADWTWTHEDSVEGTEVLASCNINNTHVRVLELRKTVVYAI
jgi:hypothetical protein